MYTIYALVDPRDSTVRYIGLTQDVYERFKAHLRCNGTNPQKDTWIQELQEAQVMLVMHSLEQVETIEQAREREIAWIRYYLDLEPKLTNILSTKPMLTIALPPVPPKIKSASKLLIPPDLREEHLTYQLQHRKCGKAACSSCKDGNGHGPYWYAYWREKGGRLRSRYIGKNHSVTTS